MQFSLYPYQLQFRYPFKISHGVRTHTDVVYLKLDHDGATGWGEASLPPYLPETQASVISFLSQPDLISSISAPFHPVQIAKRIAAIAGNYSAKAALDMALWHLKANLENKNLSELLGVSAHEYPLCTFTLGISTKDEVKQKVDWALAHGFRVIKIKLNGVDDEEMIASFRSVSDLPFAVDVNQGWKTADEALEKSKWLSKEGCILVEQPMPVSSDSLMEHLKQASPLPLYADESCQTIDDLLRIANSFHGVNIKLMKCGGLSAALEMIHRAKDLGLKILVGCMSESSVGCTAAAMLSPYADLADLDGPYLIANDPFEGMKVNQGRIEALPLVAKPDVHPDFAG